MGSSWTIAQDFLAGLDNEEKNQLYNDLLMVEKIHRKNQHVKHYSLRKLRRASHRLFEDRKRSVRCLNNKHDEIVIHQIQEQHLFKTCYRIQVLYNLKEVEFILIQDLLTSLKEEIKAGEEIQFAAI